MFLKKSILLIFILSCLSLAYSQENEYYYFVYLKDKGHSEFQVNNPIQFLSQKAIDRRIKLNIPIIEQDLPLNSQYIRALHSIENCEILNQSKWLNAVEVRFKDSLGIKKISTLPFVNYVQFLGAIKHRASPEVQPIDSIYMKEYVRDSGQYNRKYSKEDYGDAYHQNSQLNIVPLHNQMYKGKGILIAVLDAGFLIAYKTPGMNFNFNTLVVKDFVAHDNSVWEDDRHGANVLSFMKTNNPGTYIGSAPLADYILLRTEESTSEFPTEEVNWLAAAEFADSMGVDLISSSLGYNQFNDTSLSHTHKDLDGKTSIIAKAANIANSKGIFLVVSAGNEGKNKWHKIGTPSDALGVFTIGACDAEGFQADFSSYGPSADGRIKPDFMAMGKKAVVASVGGNYTGNGTSYSTPLFAGALACLIQACPSKNFEDVKNALIATATHVSAPDSANGYGMPDLSLAAILLGNYLNIDTTRDIFWQNEEATYYQNLNIHFRSSADQMVEIKISGKRKKKEKTLSIKKITLKKGEWLHNHDLFLLMSSQTKVKKRKKMKTITMEFITPAATYQRSFTLGN